MKYKEGQTVWYAGRWRFVIESWPHREYWQKTKERRRCTLQLDERYNMYLLGLCSNPLKQKWGFESWIDSQQQKRPRAAKKRRTSTKHSKPR